MCSTFASRSGTYQKVRNRPRKGRTRLCCNDNKQHHLTGWDNTLVLIIISKSLIAQFLHLPWISWLSAPAASSPPFPKREWDNYATSTQCNQLGTTEHFDGFISFKRTDRIFTGSWHIPIVFVNYLAFTRTPNQPGNLFTQTLRSSTAIQRMWHSDVVRYIILTLSLLSFADDH